MTKEELTKIIDSLHLQIVWVRMCIDIAEYLHNIDKSKLKNAKNFWHLTRTSLAYCRNFEKELKAFSAVSTKLYNRRNKSLAHNDKDYYFYNKESVDKFYLEFDEIKELSMVIYNFAVTMQNKIDSPKKNFEYPTYYDDVKRLFGEKTEIDILLETEW